MISKGPNPTGSQHMRRDKYSWSTCLRRRLASYFAPSVPEMSTTPHVSSTQKSLCQDRVVNRVPMWCPLRKQLWWLWGYWLEWGPSIRSKLTSCHKWKSNKTNAEGTWWLAPQWAGAGRRWDSTVLTWKEAASLKDLFPLENTRDKDQDFLFPKINHWLNLDRGKLSPMKTASKYGKS